MSACVNLHLRGSDELLADSGELGNIEQDGWGDRVWVRLGAVGRDGAKEVTFFGTLAQMQALSVRMAEQIAERAADVAGDPIPYQVCER